MPAAQPGVLHGGHGPLHRRALREAGAALRDMRLVFVVVVFFGGTPLAGRFKGNQGYTVLGAN